MHECFVTLFFLLSTLVFALLFFGILKKGKSNFVEFSFFSSVFANINSNNAFALKKKTGSIYIFYALPMVMQAVRSVFFLYSIFCCAVDVVNNFSLFQAIQNLSINVNGYYSLSQYFCIKAGTAYNSFLNAR